MLAAHFFIKNAIAREMRLLGAKSIARRITSFRCLPTVISRTWGFPVATSGDWLWRQRMAAKSQSVRFINRHAITASATTSGFLTDLGAKTLASVKSTLRALQTARMMSVLASMSDAQLAQIGIARCEIPRHAEKLIADD